MSKEDTIVNLLIETFEGVGNTEFDLEVPYNNYGDKGVVDLVVRSYMNPAEIYTDEYRKWGSVMRLRRRTGTHEALRIVEIKSEYAVKQSTGANEILRQFRKHQEHFFPGSQYAPDNWDSISYWLIFQRTGQVERHLRENYNMYSRSNGAVFVYDISDHMMERVPQPRANREKPTWLKSCGGTHDCYNRVEFSNGSRDLCESCVESLEHTNPKEFKPIA